MPAFAIQRVAIHFVDKGKSTLTLSKAEVNRESYAPGDWKSIEDFLSQHLARAWDAEVSGQTRAAAFASKAPLQSAYAKLRKSPGTFFDVSVTTAENLFAASPATASPGLLLALWFEAANAPQPFLGLFKLDPGERDQVKLKSDKAGQLLLDLAVEHIQWALPEPDRVLKWALIPHPPAAGEPLPFDLKLRDQQSDPDPAAYFAKFLGCQPRPSARQQVAAVFEVLGAYAEKVHPGRRWEPGVEPFVQALRAEQEITPKVVARQAKAHVLPELDENAFLKRLEASRASGMSVSPALVRKVKIRYELPGDITIEGPAAAMASVTIEEKPDGSVEFRIPTTRNYKREVLL